MNLGSTSSIAKKSASQEDDVISSNLHRQEEEEEKLPTQNVKNFFSPVKAPVESSPKPLPTQSAIYEEEKTVPSITVTSVNEDLLKVRPIRISPPKPGKLYPNLSDIEASTTESESDCVENSNNSTLIEEKDDLK